MAGAASDTIVKVGPAELLRIEVAKSRSAHAASLQTDLYHVPAVISFDEGAGVAAFERIANAAEMGRLSDPAFAGLRLPERLGEALAHIHRTLELPVDMRVPLPTAVDVPEHGPVCIHGDFNGHNVLVGNHGARITIVDWMTTRRIRQDATVGTPWFDVAWFVRWQFTGVYLTPFGRCDLDEPCARFVRSYMAASSAPTRGREFGAYLLRLSAVERKQRRQCMPLRRRIALMNGDIRLGRFARDLRIAGAHGRMAA